MSEKPTWDAGEIVVEFVGPRNQHFTFKPLGMRLRGRWVTSNVRREATRTNFTLHPDIPGVFVCLNIKKKVVRVLDPLTWDEYENTLKDANRVRGSFFSEGRGWEPVVKDRLTESEIKSILWDLVQRQEGGDLVVHHGEIPDRQSVLDRKGQLRLRYGILMDKESVFATEEELDAFGGTVVDTMTVSPMIPEMS